MCTCHVLSGMKDIGWHDSLNFLTPTVNVDSSNEPKDRGHRARLILHADMIER